MTTYTWTDDAMRSGSTCDVDKVADNLMHLKYENVSAQDGKVPYSVNSGLTSINKVSDTEVSFTGNPTITFPNGKSYTNLTLNNVIGISTDGTYDFIIEEADISNNAVTPRAVNTAQLGKDLKVSFSNANANDDYGLNTPTIIGSPTFTGNKFNSNGTTGVLYPLTSLGSGAWCITQKWKSTNSSVAQDLFHIANSSTTFGFQLYKTAGNNLSLYISSNNSSWNIANGTTGTKSDWSTSSDYWTRTYFTGTAYKVDYSIDSTNGIDGTWVNDITISSSAPVHSNLSGLWMGCACNNTIPLIGTMNFLALTVGSPIIVNRNILNETLANGTGGFDGDYNLNIQTKPLYPEKKISGIWTGTQFIKIGGAVRTSGTLGTPYVYAFNRYYISDWQTLAVNTRYDISHKLGTTLIEAMLFAKESSTGKMAHACDYFYNAAQYGTARQILDKNTFSFMFMGNVLISTSNGSGENFTADRYLIIVKGAF